MDTIRLNDFAQKDGKIFKIIRKWDAETVNIQEYFMNGGVGEILENIELKDFEIIKYPYTVLYPEKAEKLRNKKIGDTIGYVLEGCIDENEVITKKKEIAEKFNISPKDIIFYIEESEYDENYDPEPNEDPSVGINIRFNRDRTEQEINDEICDEVIK